MDEVKDLLQAWGLPELTPIFQSNAVNLQSLAALSYEEIKELIPQVGPRALFMRCYKTWKMDFTTASIKDINLIDTSDISITDLVFPLSPEQEINAQPETPEQVHKLTEPPSISSIENDRDLSQSILIKLLKEDLEASCLLNDIGECLPGDAP